MGRKPRQGRRGERALEQGRRLGPPDIGLLAALGLARVPVFERLRVALFSTGDELIEPPLLAARGGVWFACGERHQLHVGVSERFAAADKAHPALQVRAAALRGAVRHADDGPQTQQLTDNEWEDAGH